MLIEFKFRNILSFKDEVKFSMVNKSLMSELDAENITTTTVRFDLLKIAAIYGANGSGKTNFGRAIHNFTEYIGAPFEYLGYRDAANYIYSDYFRLDATSANENSMFEVTFFYDHHIYRYGFEFRRNIVEKEWLYCKKNDAEEELFLRQDQSFTINQHSFEEGAKHFAEVNKKTLLLSHLISSDQPISTKIYAWLNQFNALDDEVYPYFTKRKLFDDENFAEWIKAVLKYLGVSNTAACVEEAKIDCASDGYKESHRFGEKFPIEVYLESCGVIKLIYMLGPIYDALSQGGVIFIDEFDGKLHPNLSRKLLQFLWKFNRKKAQFIFSTQDANLLNSALIKKDQIRITIKDQFGVSSFHELPEFDKVTLANISDLERICAGNTLLDNGDTLQLMDKITLLLNG